MNIVYYSSDLFSEMCGVAIQSLCENNKDADDINIYVVEDNISDENKKRLNNIVSPSGPMREVEKEIWKKQSK